MTMFVTSPEKALQGDKKLVIPYYATQQESQFIFGKLYDRKLAMYIESTLDFYGLRNLFSGGGIITDFVELENPYEHKKGESPIEKDLRRLQKGELKTEDIAGKYNVDDGRLSVVPDIMEQDISPGLVYSDYLLKYTPEGRRIR